MDLRLAKETAIVIPAYKPDDRLPPYVKALKDAGFGKVIVVDDGSGEGFAPIFNSMEQDETVHVISYMPNGGKGVALRAGMTYVKDCCPEQRFIVTADSDGQHTVKDVIRMAEALDENHEGMLLGSRDFSGSNVPPKSRMGNRITSVIFKLLYGRWVGDTQTGLRGFDRAILPSMLAVKGDRYEYEMNELIECAGLKLPIRPLTIETVYENNNEGTHFRVLQDSARIYGVIFAGFFRFISTSLISFLVDYLLYLLLNNLFKAYVPALEHQFRFLFISVISRIALATIAARIVSGTVNYFLNFKVVFRYKGSNRKSFPRYLGVFFLIMLLSAGLTSSMHLWLGWSDNTAKIPVDIALFFLSYYLQRKWVFPKKLIEENQPK
ncbi:MAG: bifunctional glycosyltransferase family 2/GtrA family protein [Eubacteriales bacterium]|nr:bifunctional glycosyltransferase family 2/GtrA family protein [Eubacteriales bacterium]